jgi:hypothetical protein
MRLKGWKNKFEEEKQGDHASDGNDDGTIRRGLASLKADGTEEKSRKPQIRPPNHCRFGHAIEEKPVDANGEGDARDEDKLVDRFHFLSRIGATHAGLTIGKILNRTRPDNAKQKGHATGKGRNWTGLKTASGSA